MRASTTPMDRLRLDELYEKAIQIEKLLAKERAERAKAWAAEDRESRRLRTLRTSRRAESLCCARNIFEWIHHFAHSAKGGKILSILGEVAIFQDQYWDGKPRDDPDCQSMLILDSQGTLRYREFSHDVVNSNGRILVAAEDMVRLLHPDYINSAAQAMAAGEVYDNIERALKQRWVQPAQRGQAGHL